MANLFSFKDSSLARCFIKALYYVALVCITIAVVIRVGDLAMHRGGVPGAEIQAPPVAGSPSTMPNADSGAQPDGQWARHHGNWHHHRPGFRGPAVRLLQLVPQEQRPMAVEVFLILRTLVWGLVAIMVLRIFAEIGLAILSIPARRAEATRPG